LCATFDRTERRQPMNFDPRTLLTTRNWFSSSVGYHGNGRAEFVNPSAVVEGPVTVFVMESGRVHVEMDVERVSPAQPAVDWATNLNTSPNPTCERLLVRCADGEFSATHAMATGTTMWLKGEPNASAHLSLSPLQSEFVSFSTGEPAYWVLPLLNFLAYFIPSPPTLWQHPLRSRPVQSLPSNLTPEELTRRKSM
jgi:hypothetical protein